MVELHPLHLQRPQLVILSLGTLLQERVLEAEVRTICYMYQKTETVVMEAVREALVKNVEKNPRFIFTTLLQLAITV